MSTWNPPSPPTNRRLFMISSWSRECARAVFGSLASRRSKKAPRRPRAFRPTVEGLETRTLPSFIASIRTPINTDVAVVALATGDFNGDGIPDVVVAEGNSRLAIMLGNGDGAFQLPIVTNPTEQVSAVAVGDFDGDTKLDVAALGKNL